MEVGVHCAVIFLLLLGGVLDVFSMKINGETICQSLPYFST